MTLFELQAWLGHRTPNTTQHYAKITPNTLTKAYPDAGYFARNVRTIEVLLDRDAVTSGAAATGQPWQHYDLGHGYCTYTFFEQCPHRMACARCDFYTPKDSDQGPAPRGQGQPATHARLDPAHRRRTRRRRRRPAPPSTRSSTGSPTPPPRPDPPPARSALPPPPSSRSSPSTSANQSNRTNQIPQKPGLVHGCCAVCTVTGRVCTVPAQPSKANSVNESLTPPIGNRSLTEGLDQRLAPARRTDVQVSKR